MSGEPILRVTGVGKRFLTDVSLPSRLWRWLGLTPGTQGDDGPGRWVLRNLSFEVRRGEAIALVGENGAGKSTALKIIARAMEATAGRVEHHGTTAAILELGLGFRPELTGRDNARHTSSLMGLGPAAIAQALPSIEAFAELGAYFDRPLREYSSGMQARLAFAVATSQSPDLLIVDEALSVGDIYFQHKSMGRIRQLLAQGTALLLVSHDRSAVLSLCNRALLIRQGCVAHDGAPDVVMDYYNALLADKEGASIRIATGNHAQAMLTSGTKEATFVSCELQDDEGKTISEVTTGDAIQIAARCEIRHDIDTLVFGFSLRDRLGNVVFGTNTWHTQQTLENLKAGAFVNIRCRMDAELGTGTYSIQVALVDGPTHLGKNFDWIDNAIVFKVNPRGRSFFAGLCRLPTSIVMEVAP